MAAALAGRDACRRRLHRRSRKIVVTTEAAADWNNKANARTPEFPQVPACVQGTSRPRPPRGTARCLTKGRLRRCLKHPNPEFQTGSRCFLNEVPTC